MKSSARFLMTLVLLASGSAVASAGPRYSLRAFPNPDPQPYDSFGVSVATSDNLIVVGASGDNGEQGAVYVFPKDSSTPLYKLHGDAPRDAFGYSVAVVDSCLAVAAPWADGTQGAVSLYNVHTGEFIRKIESPTLTPGDYASVQFGAHVAPYGDDKFLVTGVRNSSHLPDEGAAWLYGIDGQEVQEFLPPTPQDHLDFGFSGVAVQDNVLIGAQRDRTNGYDSGAAHLFDADGNLLHTFYDPTPASYFGRSVDALGSDILISDYNSDTNLFRFDGSEWQQIHSFPEGGDVCAIGGDVLIRPESGTTLTLYNGQPPYEELFSVSGMRSFGPGMAALGDGIVFSADTTGTLAGTVYLIEGVVPEPSTVVLLLGAGASGLAAILLKRGRNRAKRPQA